MNWDDAYKDGVYKKHWDSSYPSPELVGFISSLRNKERLFLLDIGCGSGEDAIFLSNHFRSVYGIDISPTAIALATKKGSERKSKVTFVNGDIYDLPFENEMFDVLTDRGCLHNLSLNDWSKYEHEAYRVLKRGGTFFLRGARNDIEYKDNFIFITEKNLKTYFDDQKWEKDGPYSYTMFSDAGILFSNLFILKKK